MGSSFGASLISALGVALLPSFALAAPRVPTHVACVGDSITYGYLASNQATKSYPAVLQGLFGASVQVKNFGHNGATMLSAPYGDLPYEDQSEYGAATSFVSGAGASAVVDVIIMLGTNDSKSFNWTPSGKPKNDQQFLIDYRAMVEHFTALTPKPQVFLALPLATGNSPCCSIDGAVIHDQIVPLIQQLAVEKNLPTIDLNTPTTNHPEYFSDGVHPTDAGYALVATLMHDGLLVDLGAGGASGNGGVAGASSAGSSGVGGVGGNAAPGSSSGGAGAFAAGSSGAAGDGALGGAGASNAGGGSSSAGGEERSGAGGGGTANSAAGSAASSPPRSDDAGCALASRGPRSRALFLLGLVGLGGFVVRRRRPRF
jgi:lysophospholipase L1-like esterase